MDKRLRIKVCGMRDPGNIRAVGMLYPDFMGFILYPGSQRYTGVCDKRLFDGIPAGIRTVGVFVNEGAGRIVRLAGRCGFTCVQLHGDESTAECQQLKDAGLTVIKAFRIRSGRDLESINDYKDCCDYYLFDTAASGWGGSGKQFDWSLLQAFDSSLPFFLSGGIGPGDVKALKGLHHPQLYAADINSRFETAPGVKDTRALEQFIKELRQ
jgi:phosphoribosylanthranilate isomerase